MTAPETPDNDPQHDAESLGGAPETAEESARAKELAKLFGASEEEAAQRSAAEEAANRDSLAALFARPANAPVAAEDPAFTWDPSPALAPGEADAASAGAAAADSTAVDATDAAQVRATARRAAAAASARARRAAAKLDKAEAEAAAPVSAAPMSAAAGAAAGAATAGLATGAVDEADAAASSTAAGRPDAESRTSTSDTDLYATDPLAWLGFTDDAETTPIAEADAAASAPPVSAARASWRDLVGGDSETATAPPIAVAVAAPAEPPAAVATTGVTDTPAGSFFPAERRGIRGWSSRVRWSVAVSIVLLIGVVVGSVLIAQTISANNLAAQELAAAVADLEAAEESAADPQPLLDEAVKQYDDTVTSAQATADSAGPPLAAVAGMTAQPVLDASNAALAALVAQLAVEPPGDLPELYARGDVDMTDIGAVKAATKIAKDHVGLITSATRDVRAAQAAVQEKVDALRTAQVALGASLPETAVLIVGENRRALQSFRDAVIAASVAVPAAQNAGGSGDAELLAYAAAVTALRNDQARAETGVTPVTPPSNESNPAPAPEPVPEPPAPVETTPPAPVPSDTPTPTPTP